MIKRLFYVVTLFTFISCNKKLAYFQAGKKESFKNKQTPLILDKLIVKNDSSDHDFDTPKNEQNLAENINQFTADVSEKINFKRGFQTISDFDLSEKASNIDLKAYNYHRESTEKNLKKRKKLYPLVNDNLKIGIVFLVVAAVLAILNLNQLMLIFALASLIFLYLGLKKYFRRKRIKSWFKK